MKKIISYLIMSIIFFNILFIFYYYFKIISFWYLGLFKTTALLSLVIANGFVLVCDGAYILIHKLFSLYKLPYFKIVFLGLIIGGIFSLLILDFKTNSFNNYLAIISFFIINTIFLWYSLTFDAEREEVFG